MSQKFLVEEAIGSTGSKTRLPEEVRQEWRERSVASDGRATLTDEELRWLKAEYNWLPPKHPDRIDVGIEARCAMAYMSGGRPGMQLNSIAGVLFNPDQPQKSADDLLRDLGGQMTDPRKVDHNCPFCQKTMRWELFLAHIRPCMTKWGSLYRHTYAVAGGVHLEKAPAPEGP